jgi:hypothetical protein
MLHFVLMAGCMTISKIDYRAWLVDTPQFGNPPEIEALAASIYAVAPELASGI